MISERLILKGKFEGDHFECKEVQSKCPSKYKENMKPQQNNSAGPSAEKTIETSSAINQSPTNSEAK